MSHFFQNIECFVESIENARLSKMAGSKKEINGFHLIFVEQQEAAEIVIDFLLSASPYYELHKQLIKGYRESNSFWNVKGLQKILSLFGVDKVSVLKRKVSMKIKKILTQKQHKEDFECLPNACLEDLFLAIFEVVAFLIIVSKIQKFPILQKVAYLVIEGYVPIDVNLNSIAVY